MKKNTFKIGTTEIYIENQFIPYGKEYALLGKVIEEQKIDKGTFRMFFNSPYKLNGFILTVYFSKKH